MTTTSTPRLPAEFGDLDPFADWALAGERNRYLKRLASSMDELQAFYDTAFPRLEAACEYLDEKRIDDLADEDKNLVWLFCSLINASFPIEVWRQQRVPDSGAADIVPVLEPSV